MDGNGASPYGGSFLETLQKGRIIHLFFTISVMVKGLDGVLETVGGTLLFFVSPQRIYYIVKLITHDELVEDPRDIVANYLLHSAQHLSFSAKTFGAIYLLGHGIIKAGLVSALLLRQRWAYPAAIVAFLLFLVYQIYRYTVTHAPELLILFEWTSSSLCLPGSNTDASAPCIPPAIATSVKPENS